MAEVPSTRTLRIGATAPDFSLPDPSGKIFTLSDVRGPRGLVVAFLCNHCPFVVHLARQLGEFADDCATKGIGFVGINSNDSSRYAEDSPEKMPAMSHAHAWRFPYLHDDAQTVARACFAACTPDFFLFDAQMKLAYAGQFDASRPGKNVPVTGDDLRRAVDAVTAGSPPLPNQRPSTGCSIKWKSGNEPARSAV